MIEGSILPLGGRVSWLANSITFLVLSTVTCLVSISPGDFIEQFALFSCPLTKILSSLSQHVCRCLKNTCVKRSFLVYPAFTDSVYR